MGSNLSSSTNDCSRDETSIENKELSSVEPGRRTTALLFPVDKLHSGYRSWKVFIPSNCAEPRLVERRWTRLARLCGE